MLSRIRAAVVVVLVAGLAVSGYVGYRLFTEDPHHDPPVSSVSDTTDDGWNVVAYRGVTVEVPPDWGRLDMADCTYTEEHWGPSGLDPCADDVGLWFKESATFDAGVGPGVHEVPVSANLAQGGFGGYVTRGKVVVDVGAGDQAVVRRILQSVSEPI